MQSLVDLAGHLLENENNLDDKNRELLTDVTDDINYLYDRVTVHMTKGTKAAPAEYVARQFIGFD